MKVLRWVTVTVFILMLAVYGLFSWQEYRNKDLSYPVIQAETEEMDVSIQAEEKDLLQGVTAFDEKDGDLTDRVLVESISHFVDKNVCKVTYAVSDSDSHVAKIERKIRYTDYVPPRFTLKKPLVFKVGEKTDIRKMVGAEDCLEGDISQKVTVLSSDYVKTREGTYSLSVQVTNKRGHKIEAEFPIFVEKEDSRAPVITLKENIVYLEKGETVRWEEMVQSVTQNKQIVLNPQIEVVENVNTQVPGLYQVHYRAFDETKLHTAHTVLIVIVEE